MKEDFLHYLWKYRLLHPALRTTTGESVTVLHPGWHNRDGGPDFTNALVRIGDTTWAGNVEIHVRSSDWYMHHHDQDKAYHNVILHVVMEDNPPEGAGQSLSIPTVVVRDQFEERIVNVYRHFMESNRWIPCQPLLNTVPPVCLELWAPGLVIERLAYRGGQIRRIFEETGNDWEETLYRWLAIAFGFRVNTIPFELLSRNIPYRIIRKHDSNIIHLEALLFGGSGLLPAVSEESYIKRMIEIYKVFSNKYSLRMLDHSIWKFLRMRPGSFPTIRISQFAALLKLANGKLLQYSKELFSSGSCLSDVLIASAYWDTHYTFGKISAERRKHLGEGSFRLLMINGIIPFFFFYGRENNMDGYKDSALRLLEGMAPESNSDLQRWSELGILFSNALQSQALIHLRKEYCLQKQCLQCRIGLQVLKQEQG